MIRTPSTRTGCIVHAARGTREVACGGPGRLVPRVLAFAVMVATVLSAGAAFADEIDAWTLLAERERVRFADVEVEVPQEGFESWVEARNLRGTGRPSLVWQHRAIGDTILAIGMSEPAELEWEIALIAAWAELGEIAPDEARWWVELLQRRVDDPSDAEVLFAAAQARFDLHGSALALLPAACMPRSPRALTFLEQMARAETRLPGRRFQDRTESSPSPDFDELRAHLASPADRVGVYTALAVLDATIPAGESRLRELLAEYAPGVAADTCGWRDVVLAARLGLLAPSEWQASEARIDMLLSIERIPQKLLWRAAVHQYLATNATAVSQLVESWSTHYGDDDDLPFLRILEANVRGPAPPGAYPVPWDEQATNATWRWALAEHYRVHGDFVHAIDLLDRVVYADDSFVPGLLSYAATLIAHGEPARAAPHLERLRTIVPPVPAYDMWIGHLRGVSR